MQAQTMDLDFSPNILHTPSLMTPNITTNPLMYNPLYSTSTVDIHHDVTTSTSNTTTRNSTSNPSSMVTNSDESLSGSSGEINVSKIEDELKRGVTQTRKPTESPFQIMIASGGIPIGRTALMPSTIGDETPTDVPSTAEVMNDLESFGKYPVRDNIDRETTQTSDSHRGVETSPTHNMVLNVSPKKKLLARSQSRTDVVSPTNLKSNFDEDTPVDDGPIASHFQRVHELPPLEQNGVHPTIVKQQPTTPSAKRPYQQAFIGVPIPKLNAVVLTHPPPINEVTSSNQLFGVKRAKLPTETLTTRSAYPSSINDNNNNAIGSDDHRKKQIRDSNREAARRCRERRRHYIEQLEGNLEQCKTQIKQLTDKLSRAERENTQLRAILTETKIFHPSLSSTRLSSNENIADFANGITTGNGLTLESESTDGNVIQRTYLNRTTQ